MTAHAGDVTAASTFGEPGALREIRAVEKRIHKLRDLGRVGRAVCINHDYDVASCECKSACQRITFATSILHDDPGIGSQSTSNGKSFIHRMPVNNNDLMKSFRQPREYVWQVTGLVKRGNDYRNLWPRAF